MADQDLDVVIIGGGPAGLTAGIYTCRAGWRTLLVEKAVLGGQITFAPMVENFPGFQEGVPGLDLGNKVKAQAAHFGLVIENAAVQGLEIAGEQRRVKTSKGDFLARAVIIAGGAAHRRLGAPGEDALVGKGVSYCATCDAIFFREQVVAVVGGGDAALEEANFLTRFATKVYVIHRRDQLRAAKVLQERSFTNPAIQFIWDTVVDEVRGDLTLKSLKLRNLKTGARSELAVEGVFVSVGFEPDTAYLKGVVVLEPTGEIRTNERLETSMPGVFAAGDIRAGTLKQAIVAASDGASAAHSVDKYLSGTQFPRDLDASSLK